MNIINITFSVVISILAGGGAGAIVVKLLKDRWLESVKAQYAKDLEQLKDSLVQDRKRLQARVDRAIFVSKAQFDTEFNAMKDIYKAATDARAAMQHLRPMFEMRPADETKEDREKELFMLLGTLTAAHNAFSFSMETLRPFYPEDLYSSLVECRNATSREIVQVRTDERRLSPKGYADGNSNRDAFDASYHRVATIIRQRLDRLSVVSA